MLVCAISDFQKWWICSYFNWCKERKVCWWGKVCVEEPVSISNKAMNQQPTVNTAPQCILLLWSKRNFSTKHNGLHSLPVSTTVSRMLNFAEMVYIVKTKGDTCFRGVEWKLISDYPNDNITHWTEKEGATTQPSLEAVTVDQLLLWNSWCWIR